MKTTCYGVLLVITSCVELVLSVSNSTCGVDGSPVSAVYEGVAAASAYPWLGFLYYTFENKVLTTAVALVTRQMVVAGAGEIDRLPKDDFREVTRVVLGHKCGENEIRVRSYTLHPDYATNSYSALAIVQLELDNIRQDLRPICPPPAHFENPQFYAMTLVDGCRNPKVRIHRMEYVNINRCKSFYRKSGLDQASFWPTHTACARAISGRECVWRSGTVLTVKLDGRWRMLGFSVQGPGCGDPSRFLDYGRYHQWIRKTATSVGQPSISRLGDNHLVMRRSTSNVQKFGPCDAGETKLELYTDKVAIMYKPGNSHAKYNVTLIAGIDYSCIVFQARTLEEKDYKILEVEPPKTTLLSDAVTSVPKIQLRRWCATPTAMCFGFQNIDIKFFVEIAFSQSVEFQVLAYGQKAKILVPRITMKFMNKGPRPRIYYWLDVLTILHYWKDLRKHKWFYHEDIKLS